MPTRRPKDEEQRFAYLESIGRRCVGNNGHCINTAVDEFDVIAAIDGVPITDSPVQTLKTCGRHRLHVAAVPNWFVVSHRRQQLAGTSPRPHAAA